MGGDLTPEEEELLASLRSTRRHDTLWYEWSYRVPCFVIITLAIWKGSVVVGLIGMGVFLVFWARTVSYQNRYLGAYRSLAEKFLERHPRA